MREHIFRGRRIDGGDFVYGDLEHNGDVDVRIQGYVVDPETVGEFTGLEDINGVAVYEGDLLRYMEWKDDNAVFPVVWDKDEARFCLDVTDYKDVKQPYENKHYWPLIASHVRILKITIVGNIHNTPDMKIKEEGEVNAP